MYRTVTERTAFDYIEKDSSLSKQLKLNWTDWKPLSTEGQASMVKSTIYQRLQIITGNVPLEFGLKRALVCYEMSVLYKCFWLLKDYTTAQILMENIFVQSIWASRELDLRCLLCDKIEGYQSFWMCKDCPPDSGICPTCFESRNDEKNMRGCSMKHEFLQIGGKEWSRLPPGHVDKDGKTIDQFIAELKEILLQCIRGRFGSSR